jgi:hypothetical protein
MRGCRDWRNEDRQTDDQPAINTDAEVEYTEKVKWMIDDESARAEMSNMASTNLDLSVAFIFK